MSYAEMFIERSFGEHQSGMKTGGNIDWKRRIFRYCLELDLLHDDLARIFQFLTRVPKVQKARNLSPVRWALRYHVYNFHVRVSAYREKLYELLQLLFPPGSAIGPKKTQPALKRQIILSRLEHEGVSQLAQIIRFFEGDELLSRSFKQRNHFVHSLVLDWEEWLSVGPPGLLWEAIDQAMAEDSGDEHQVKRAQRQAQTAMDLSGYGREKEEELKRIVRRLGKLRGEICAELACV